MTNRLCSIHLFKSGDRVRCLLAMKEKGRQNWNRIHMSAIIQIVAASIGTVRLSRINNSQMQIVTPYFSFHLTCTLALASASRIQISMPFVYFNLFTQITQSIRFLCAILVAIANGIAGRTQHTHTHY